MRQVEKRKIKKRVYSWWSVILLAVIAFFFVSNTWDVYKKYVESKKNIASLHERYEDAQEREGELIKKIDHLNSESGLEEEIRGKFNVAKDGEQVVVIISSDTEEVPEVVENPGLIKRLWSKLFGVFH